MSPQTTAQILRCLTLGRYTAAVEDGELKIRGPQSLAGPLPASIKARRDELTALLSDHYDGTWPPPEPPRKSREIREREYLHSREERVREFLARIRERREGAA
jgi:hypothetical protein